MLMSDSEVHYEFDQRPTSTVVVLLRTSYRFTL